MKIEMTSKIIDITPAIRERIESRFEKLERLQVPLITPHVIISKERLMYIVEATAGIPNGKLFAQASTRICMPPSRIWARSWSVSSIAISRNPSPAARLS